MERPVSPGIRSEMWREDFRDGWSSTLFLDDVLVLTHGDQVEGRDATTGRSLWAFSVSSFDGYVPPEELLEATGDYVIAVAAHSDEDSDDPPGASLLTFNGRTGTVLWDLASGFYGSETPTPYFTYLGVGRGRALINIPALNVVRGLDVVDGRQRWEVAVPSGCTSATGEADEWVVALLMTCGSHDRMLVLDPSTGRHLWERDVVASDTSLITVSDGVIGLESDTAFIVYDITGQQLYEHAAEQTCSCTLMATASGLLILRQSDRGLSATDVMEVVNRRLRRIVRVSIDEDAFEMLQVVDGWLYGARQLGADLQGSIVVAIDLATGKQTPVATFPIYERPVDISSHALLVDPGLEDGGVTLIAYRIVPPRPDDPSITVAGVEIGRWPDACALMSPTALAAEFPGSRYKFLPRPAPPELSLATPIGCDLVPFADEHPVLTLTVLWVGRTSKEAETVLKALVGNFREEPDKIADDKSGARLYVDYIVQDAVIIRVGDTVVRMDGAGDRETSMRLITHVTGVLRAAK